MLFHIKLSDTFFEFYAVSYNEEEVLYVLRQMPRGQHRVPYLEQPYVCFLSGTSWVSSYYQKIQLTFATLDPRHVGKKIDCDLVCCSARCTNFHFILVDNLLRVGMDGRRSRAGEYAE